jgi:hypothetical protein
MRHRSQTDATERCCAGTFFNCARRRQTFRRFERTALQGPIREYREYRQANRTGDVAGFHINPASSAYPGIASNAFSEARLNLGDFCDGGLHVHAFGHERCEEWHERDRRAIKKKSQRDVKNNNRARHQADIGPLLALVVPQNRLIPKRVGAIRFARLFYFFDCGERVAVSRGGESNVGG